MKKRIVLLSTLTVLFMGGMYGAEIGAEAPALDIREWVYGALIDFAVPREMQKTSQKSTVVVTWGTWLTGARDVTPLLEQLQKEYQAKGFRVIMVSPEPKDAVGKFFGGRKDFPCYVGLDNMEKTTRAYMGQSRLFPKAFLINQAGLLVWSGEAFDLPNIVKTYYQAGFGIGDWRKLGKLYEELEVLLMSRVDNNIARVTDQILALNRDDGFAIRARLFYYNSTGQNGKAVEFLEQRVKASPHNTGVYLAAFNILSGQFPQDEEKTLQFAREYRMNMGTDTAAMQQLGMILLRDFGYMSGALELAAEIVPALMKDEPAAASTVALYFYKIGRLDEAVKWQDKAVRHANSDRQAAEMLKFYQAAQRLNRNAATSAQ